jgi:AraC family ethanolamine operon transcriptional activator
VTRIACRDFDEFAGTIDGIAGRFIPTARSAADWWVQSIPVGRVALQQFQIGSAAMFSGDGAGNVLTIAMPLGEPQCVRIDGLQLDDDSCILVRKGQPFTFAAKQPTRWSGITVPLDHLALSGELLESLNTFADGDNGGTHLKSDRERIETARQLVSRLCAGDGSVGLVDPTAARAAEEEVVACASRVLEASHPWPSKRIRRRPRFPRYRVIAKVLALLEERAGDPLFIQDLCAVTQVSERTLRNVFHEFVGVGPMRLLKVRQLMQIRCALTACEAADTTMTKIVARYGVWDYSLFARNYKALFGETPLDTVRQAGHWRSRQQVDDGAAQGIEKYQEELHGSAAWARDASLLQTDKTSALRIHPRSSR